MFDALDATAAANREKRQMAVAGQKTVISASALFIEGYPNVLRLTIWRRLTPDGPAPPLRKAECFQLPEARGCRRRRRACARSDV